MTEGLVGAVVAVGCTSGPLLLAAIVSHVRVVSRVDALETAAAARDAALRELLRQRDDNVDGRLKPLERVCGLNGSPCAFVRVTECDRCKEED